MAKLETHLTGPFDTVLDQLHQAILDGSLSASYEDGSDCTLGNARVAVRIYERYSMFGGNRVSMSLTLAGGCFCRLSPPAAARPCGSR